MFTHNQPAISKIPGAPVTMVSSFQSLMAYAHPDKAMIPTENPVQTRDPAAPRWRIPENSVVNTNIGMLKPPDAKGKVGRFKDYNFTCSNTEIAPKCLILSYLQRNPEG